MGCGRDRVAGPGAGAALIFARLAGVLALLCLALARPAEAQAACHFALGFATLHDQIPAVIGSCLEDEHHNAANGDALQRTTGGLLVWRKADNFTAFTDGYRTWVNGPFGLQTRLNTEQFPWERAAGDVYVVLAGGYGGGASPFDALVAALADRGWRGDHILPFSYAGGTVGGGAWRPAPYGCEATGAPLAGSAALLAKMLADHGAAHPGARYVVVGHSLGGLVGWTYLQGLRASGAPSPLVGLVTVDAPLRGVSAEKRLAAMLGGCGGPVLDDFGRLYADAAGLAAVWADLAGWARGRGVAVTTIGSDGDCLYAPRLPGCDVAYAQIIDTPDDRETQYVASAAVHLAIPIDPAWPPLGPLGRVSASHLAPLNDPAAVARIVGYVVAATGAG